MSPGASPYRYVSTPRRVREDRRFVAGKGRFVADIVLPNTKHVALVTCPHAAARIVGIDKSAALAMPGVHYILDGAELAAARTIRDDLARHVDVSTLDSWIARNVAIDAALRDLYTRLVASKGRVTPEVRAALAGVDAARAQLPPDTRALVVILADIARGGLNQAVITIEQARGRLAAAGGAVL